jgi:hypothetical protein
VRRHGDRQTDMSGTGDSDTRGVGITRFFIRTATRSAGVGVTGTSGCGGSAGHGDALVPRAFSAALPTKLCLARHGG